MLAHLPEGIHELSERLESLERRKGSVPSSELVDILHRASMQTMNEAWGRRVMRQVERLSAEQVVLETVRTAEGVLDERFGVRPPAEPERQGASAAS